MQERDAVRNQKNDRNEENPNIKQKWCPKYIWIERRRDFKRKKTSTKKPSGWWTWWKRVKLKEVAAKQLWVRAQVTQQVSQVPAHPGVASGEAGRALLAGVSSWLCSSASPTQMKPWMVIAEAAPCRNGLCSKAGGCLPRSLVSSLGPLWKGGVGWEGHRGCWGGTLAAEGGSSLARSSPFLSQGILKTDLPAARSGLREAQKGEQTLPRPHRAHRSAAWGAAAVTCAAGSPRRACSPILLLAPWVTVRAPRFLLV